MEAAAVARGNAAAPPLEGLCVLDLTGHIAGPHAAKLLAVAGARVIKVERPRQGDPMRWIGPFAGDRPGADRSLGFLDLNVNKLGVTLDLACATGRELALELVARSDVVLESFRPGTLDRFGLGYDELAARRPAIVLTSISNFGQSGPYRDLPASELMLYGMGGAMHGSGHPQASPISVAPRVTLALAGQTAAVATMGAALAAARRGDGEWIDVSIMETLLACVDRRAHSLTAYAYSGRTLRRQNWDGGGLAVPATYTRCADGWIVALSASTPASWAAFVRAIGDPWWENPAYVPPVADEGVRRVLRERWEQWCTGHTMAELTERLQGAGFPCAPVNTIDAVVEDHAFAARGFFADVEHPQLGTIRHPGPFAAFTGTPGRVRSPAPGLGEHNELVYGELGLEAGDLVALASAGVI